MKRKTVEKDTSIHDLLKVVPTMKDVNNEDLKSSLLELESLIEMDYLKKSVVDMMQYELINRRTKKPTDKRMLHLSICGPPGVGKTTAGKVIAKLLLSLKLVQPKAAKKEKMASQYFIESVKNMVTMMGNLHNIEKTMESISEQFEESDNDKQRGKIYYEEYKELCEATDAIKGSLKDFSANSLFNEGKEMKQKITIGTRENFVGEYLGHTAPKTRAFLDSCLGGVLIIDEAYSLITSERDSFGMEALTILNEYMSNYSEHLIVIFCGYRDLLEQSIFSSQPGLKRRIMWTFDVEGYTHLGLLKIFQYQLKKEGWSLKKNLDLQDLFKKEKDLFKSFGGDTEKLIIFSRMSHARSCSATGKVTTTLSLENILAGIETLRKSKGEKKSDYPQHLYL